MIRKEHQPWLGAGGVLLVLGSLGWRAPSWLGTSGPAKILLTGGLLVFAIALAIVTLLFLRARLRARKEAAVEGAEDIDQALAAAHAQLASSKLTTDARIARLPLALVLGPVGSTKTSILTHCGLDPELLSGEVMRGDAVVPTNNVNVWYAHGTILVEAGGRLLDDAQRWRRVVHHLRPRRLAAAIGRGKQATRIAILCIGCDEFQKPGAAQNLSTIARQLRARLSEASQQLGIRLPVYVLFTRTDRLQPYFADYMRSFTNEEAHQVLGATLPLASEAGAAWADRESKRLNEAFGQIVRSLATRRLDVIARESDEGVRASAYEFPRELRKITEPAVQLLLDIFRPSQLGVNPFLRGFYFTGVRPVILRDLMSDAAPAAPQQAAPGYDPGATSVFNPALLRQMPQQVPVIHPSGRKVPQWVFLTRLFQEVLLRDSVALRITSGGTRVDMLRRGLIGSLAAAGVILALGSFVSWRVNTGMLNDSTVKARQLLAADAGSETEVLTSLDSVRAQLERLRTERNWLTSGWWLDRGDAAHERLRALYFTRFEAALWQRTRTAVNAYLDSLPDRPEPNSSFTLAHDALAAYLLTTREDTLSKPDMLQAALLSFWPSATAASDTLRELARRQFRFFGEELPRGNPYDVTANTQLVDHTRAFLREFGPDAYYSALIAEVGDSVSARNWPEQNIVRNGVTVSGAFTQQGWNAVEMKLDSVETFMESRAWLYGPQGLAQKPNRDTLVARYANHYIAEWHRYLAGASIAPFGSPTDAATKLAQLGSGASPLFRMLAIASQQTDLRNLPDVNKAFAPLHAVVPPNADAGLTSRAPVYTSLLTSLGQQLTGLTPGGDPTVVQQVAVNLDNEIVNIGRVDSTAAASQTLVLLHQLLRQPSAHTQSVIRGRGIAEGNAAGENFCRQYSRMVTGYPFRRTAGAPDADVAAVGDMFRKNDGALATFFQGTLQPYINWSGQPNPNAPHRVTESFRAFFKRAAEFSDAVYDGGRAAIGFRLRPRAYPEGIDAVVLSIEGAATEFTRTNNAWRSFEWRLGQNTSARLAVRGRGGETVIAAPPPGPWSIFRVFDTTWSAEGSGSYSVTWPVAGSSALEIEFMPDGQNVFGPYLQALSRCPGTILN